MKFINKFKLCRNTNFFEFELIDRCYGMFLSFVSILWL